MFSSSAQDLSQRPDISASSEVAAAANVLKNKLAALLAKRKATVFKAPTGIDSTQFMPGQTCTSPYRFLRIVSRVEYGDAFL